MFLRAFVYSQSPTNMSTKNPSPLKISAPSHAPSPYMNSDQKTSAPSPNVASEVFLSI